MEIGDTIEIESEVLEVEVVAIIEGTDGRNVIFFTRKNYSLGLFIEGDEEYELVD